MPSTSQQSPVLCESSPPPPHTWQNSDLLSTSAIPPPPPVRLPIHTNMSNQQGQDQAAEAAQIPPEDSVDSDTSSVVSVETPRTASTPQSDPLPFPDLLSSSQQLAESNSTITSPQEADTQNPTSQPNNNTQDSTTATNDTTPAATIPPPQPASDLERPPPPRDDVPEWVKYEEDTSVPAADELKEIEAKEKQPNASNVSAMEKSLFPDIDDPEMRPVKKLRMSWTIKGVRGTREKPNRSRIMLSPTFEYEGQHWNIKFFPRGNKSRSSLAAFIRCSNIPLNQTSETTLEGNFKCYAGAADDVELEEKLNLNLVPAEPKEEKMEEKKPEEQKTEAVPIPQSPSLQPADSNEQADSDSDSSRSSQRRVRRRGEAEDSSSDSSDDDDDEDDIVIPTQSIKAKAEQQDFRISAQLGMVIYNPDEPRTCYEASSEHQFCPHEDDWGWDNLISRWDEIHRRKYGQRQALLRNDTLVIDAYIRIFEDPSKALFWHSSNGESQWDSKLLAGYYPMGTRLLYHSPAVAGLTAWSLLAPFRKVIQSIDAGHWKADSTAKPRPLLASLQLMLFQMRQMKKEEVYIHLDNVILEVQGPGETFYDVKSFWELFRRTIEFELEDDSTCIENLSDIFGPSDQKPLPILPVQGVQDIQRAVDQAFEGANVKTELPNFLPLMLDRHSFDSSLREWKLHHDRVRLLDDIDVSRFCTDGDGRYTLYGFVVHDGELNSGRFFSIVRPAGPGGKWLAFSDGNGNKVFSHTRKSLVEFEGLEGEELKKFASTRQTAYMAMYIRTSCLKEYLLPVMEEYRLPIWLEPFLEEPYHASPDNFDRSNEVQIMTEAKVEVFWDASIIGHEGTLNMFNMKNSKLSREPVFHQRFTCSVGATFRKLRQEIATILKQNEDAVRFWTINFYRLGQYSKVYMHAEDLDSLVSEALPLGETLCLWLALKPEQGITSEDSAKDLFTKLDGIYIEAPPVPKEEQPAQDTPNPTSEIPEANNTTTNDAQTSLQVAAPAEVTPNIHASEASRSAVEESASGPDAEQDSVRNAVASDVQNAVAESSAVTASGPLVSTSEVQEHHVTQSEDNTTELRQEAGNTESIASPSEGPQNTQSPETLVADQITSTATDQLNFEAVDGAVVLPDIQSTIVTVETALGDIPGDLSAEDAALISSMIAADMEAVERERHDRGNTRNRSESRNHNDVAESRSTTPRLPAGDVYGFLQFFDTEKQTIETRKPFFAEKQSKISDMVRKHLQYEADRPFQIWRREGPYGASSVSLESTFADVELQDGCDVIVGDVLSESKLEELKQRGEASSPGPLIKYIVMTRHRHPILSKTSSESVEIGGFGTDYYRGPIVHGQKHGTNCLFITSNGETYEGPVLVGKKNGSNGKMTYQTGDVYTGDWLDDLRHGQGEFTEKRTGNRYVGGYQDDRRWGRGVTYWEKADQEADLCQICYFCDVDALFYECGHVCACYVCAKECDCCPICRKTVKAVVRMYRS